MVIACDLGVPGILEDLCQDNLLVGGVVSMIASAIWMVKSTWIDHGMVNGNGTCTLHDNITKDITSAIGG